jgi:uncharacterized membrane protein
MPQTAKKSTVGQRSTVGKKSTAGQKSTVGRKTSAGRKTSRPPQKAAASSRAKSNGKTGSNGHARGAPESDSLLPEVAGKAFKGGLTSKLAGKAIKHLGEKTLPAAGQAARTALEKVRDGALDKMRNGSSEPMLARARKLPIQRSVDVAVPIDVAWDEWQNFEFLPEGTHKVSDVERDDDGHLVGRVTGFHLDRDWEAEIVDERIDESFAWHSVGGSDCSGLATFHELGDRLTRIELHVDVIPGGVADAVALVLRVADRRAEADLRRFKAHVEALDPDDYPRVVDVQDEQDDLDEDEQDEQDESD